MTSATTENAFMADLFADLDASIFSEALSPVQTRSSPSQVPRKNKRLTIGTSQNSRKYGARHDVPCPVKLSQSPSPRKRAVKRVKYEAEGSTSLLFGDTSERQDAIKEITDSQDASHVISSASVYQHCATTQPIISERKHKVEAQQSGVEGVTTPEDRYTRCIVKEVLLEQYVPQKYQKTDSKRHTTKGVLPGTVTSAMQRRQKIIYVSDLELIDLSALKQRRHGKQKEGKLRKVILRDEWYSTEICAGDVIHLIGGWKEQRDCHVQSLDQHDKERDMGDPDEALWDEMEDMPSFSQETHAPIVPTMILTSSQQTEDGQSGEEVSNLLILHPDLLLSATAISTVVRCTRKAYLQNKLKPSGPTSEDAPSEALLMGKLLHEVLQSCLTGRPKDIHKGEGSHLSEEDEHTSSPFPTVWQGPGSTNFSHRFVREQVQSQVQASLEDIMTAGLSTEMATDKLWNAVAPFGHFASRFLLGDERGDPKKDAEAIDKRSDAPHRVLVKRVLDVEEDIWSPMYGLKGFIDVSVEVEMVDAADKGQGKKKTVLMPLELKTGRSVDIVQHQAQTMLYNLMMSDRYRREVGVGLLYYSKSSTLHLVRSVRNEVRALLIARNELAGYLNSRANANPTPVKLPPLIEREQDCGRCYVSNECMLYKRAVESTPMDDESPVAGIYEAKVTHLSQKHVDFFKHWEKLLSLEEEDVVRFRRELWTMTAQARESTGRCLANMVLSSDPLEGQHSTAQSRVRSLSGMNERLVFHFFRAGENALLMGGNFSVGDPVTVSIEPRTYSIAQGHVLSMTPHAISLTLDRDLQTYMKRCKARHAVFRIDKEEFASGMARVRYNLAKLFFPAPLGDVRRRDLVVDLQCPRFADAGKGSGVDESINSGSLNEDQERAIQKVLSAQDYALIVGMPGTGKTTTIVHLIVQLVRQGKSILLTSYTHSAVDTLCRKLVREASVKLLRLGKSDRVHCDVQAHMFQPAMSVEALGKQVMQANVVATTCLSISHALFAKRTFDYCIVDEASQITLPTCLGPLRYADKFVLVGDPLQLPPLVKNAGAKEGGLDVSLFDLLQRAHPQSVVQLQVQYRMNKDIMTLSNDLIYQGQLRCGDRETRESSLHLPDLAAARERLQCKLSKACKGDACWMERILAESTRALFIDTDALPGSEVRVGETLLQNEQEAEIVVQVSAALACAGVAKQEMCVITPYRQQLRLLVKRLGGAASAGDDKIEVLTADKAQGRDKDVVLISFVRSNKEDASTGDKKGEAAAGIGQLLNDAKRINVALTRARKKLIIVGSRRTLSRSTLLGQLWHLMHEKGWTMSLSEAQLRQHQDSLAAVWTGVHQSPARSVVKATKPVAAALLRGRPILHDILNEAL